MRNNRSRHQYEKRSRETPRAGAVLPILSLSALSFRTADLPSGFLRLLGVGGYPSSSDSFNRSCETWCKTLANYVMR
jgi:hypothetical protein